MDEQSEFELPEPIDTPDKDADEAKLQAELQSYHEAMEQEFEVGVRYKDGMLTPGEIKEKTEEILTAAIPQAVARMKYLAVHGKNETVQLNAAKFIIERGLGKTGGGIADPMQAILEHLNKDRSAAS